jgi:hypothetical protein
MAKSQSKKQVKQTRVAAEEVKSKISAKLAASYRAIGAGIVEAETETRTVFDAYMKAFGLKDDALVLVADGLDKKWEAIYAAIKAGVPNVKGKRELVSMSQRTAYNRRSDDVAVINSFRAMAQGEKGPRGMTAAEFKKQVLALQDKGSSDMRGTLVTLSRAYVGRRAGSAQQGDAKVKRIESAWKNKPGEVLAALKMQVSHAPLASLLVLEGIINRRIEAIKRQAKAPVSQLRKAA